MFSSKTKEKDIFAAYEHFALGRYSKALKDFEEYYALYPDSTSSLNIIGTLYLLNKDKKKAESIFMKLIQKLDEAAEYDKIFSIINKLAFVIEDHDRLYKMRADVYRKKDKNELAIRQQLILAERYRHSGNFDACNNLYLEIAEKNQNNYRVINKIIQRLSMMGAYAGISDVLKRSTEHNLFPVDELDNIIIFLIESGAKPENVMPFIRDFLSRHPESFETAETMLLQQLKKEFDSKLFSFIVSVVPAEKTREFTFRLKDLVDDVSIVRQALLLEAEVSDRDTIKGLVFELYVDSGLNPVEIAEICLSTGTYIPYEETLKICASSMEKKEIIESLEKLAEIYRNAGESARADSISVYAKYNRVPESLSDVFSLPPENPIEIEHRLDVRTSVKETVVEIIDEPAAVISESAAQPPHEQDISENNESNQADTVIRTEPFEVESHSYQPSGSFSSENIELDVYNSFDSQSVVDASLDIADDFGRSSAVNTMSSSVMEGLETFFTAEPETEVVVHDIGDGGQNQPESVFSGFDDAVEPDTVNLGFMGFDDTASESGYLFPSQPEVEPDNEISAEEVFESIGESDNIKLPETTVMLDIDQSEAVQSQTVVLNEDYFAGMENEIRKQAEPEQNVQTISFDEKELAQAKKKNDDFFSQEI